MKRIGSSLSLLVLLALAGATPAPAQQPAARSWGAELWRLREETSGLLRLRAAPRFAAIVAEREPNNSVATANGVVLGDQATGVVNPPGDVDTWFVDLTAGQFFSVDVDAFEAGSPLDATLELIAPDGRTSLAFNDDFDDFDSRISYRIPTSGRYYVVLRGFGAMGGPGLTYAINFGKVACDAGGTEQEPNGTPGSATPLVIGADGTGAICASDDDPAGDVDYWAFTARAGTTLELDVDAAALGLLVDPFVALYASDGITRLAFNDDNNGDGTDSRLQFSITTTGTYFAAVSSLADPGGNPFPYTLHLRSIAGGPGDPIRVHAQNVGRPLGLAVGSTGDLFAGDLTGNRIVRITRQGGLSTFASGIQSPEGLAFDAFGQLLAVSGDGVVYRVSSQGQATRFITDAGIPIWVAVAPDGRIWLSDLSDRSLRRYSATGQFEARFDAIDIGGFGPGPLAIGPSGEPHFSNGNEIWKLANGQLRRVLGAPFVIWGFAFDLAGNIYAPSPVAGRILLFDAAGRTLADPFAVGPDAPQAVAFGRDGTGATEARVFATEMRIGQVIEVNPAGVAQRGLPMGFVPPAFTRDVAINGLLGAGGLSAADQQLLDAIGNHNGRYDVGDLRAYLMTLGGAPSAATPAQRRAGSQP
jgi:hypothetical protein